MRNFPPSAGLELLDTDFSPFSGGGENKGIERSKWRDTSSSSSSIWIEGKQQGVPRRSFAPDFATLFVSQFVESHRDFFFFLFAFSFSLLPAFVSTHNTATTAGHVVLCCNVSRINYALIRRNRSFRTVNQLLEHFDPFIFRFTVSIPDLSNSIESSNGKLTGMEKSLERKKKTLDDFSKMKEERKREEGNALRLGFGLNGQE